jgi:crotonobetainyl-CoA:carnitine CoA-transferase CaiB-like acyl-CoA transferase
MVNMFNDLRVLELASVLAGPSVGQFFAELGADVIKVENSKTSGDVTRSWKSDGEQTDDRSAYFCSVNWGKKSIALDLTLARDRKIVHQLATKSDVVIASYKPGDAKKLGVAYEQLLTNNPQLIYGQITGYGSKDARVGYDAVIQAESGFMFMNGEPNGNSLKMPVALIDILAGHQLKEGLLLALLHKERTGKGNLVEVSLIQTAIASLANQASNYLVGGKIPQKQGSSHPNIAPYGDVFLTSDTKQLLLAVGSDKQFEDLLQILEIPLDGLDKFLTNQKRVENRKVLNKILSVEFSKHSSDELLAKFHQFKIPVAIIQDLQQVFAMPCAQELLIESNTLKGVKTFVANFPTLNFESGILNLSPPPHLGEHTEEIIVSLQQ